MKPALKTHLYRMFLLSLKAEALADVLNALAGDPEYQDASVQMAMALSSITCAISDGLDMPEQFGVAA